MSSDYINPTSVDEMALTILLLLYDAHPWGEKDQLCSVIDRPSGEWFWNNDKITFAAREHLHRRGIDVGEAKAKMIERWKNWA